MSTILLVIHSFIVIMIIGLVLLQRSEGGVLGMSGGGGLSGLMTGRGQRNALTRATAILAGLFFATSLGISIATGWEQKRLDDHIPAAAAGENLNPSIPPQHLPLNAQPSGGPEPLSQKEKEPSGSSFPSPEAPASKSAPSSGKPASLPNSKTP